MVGSGNVIVALIFLLICGIVVDLRCQSVSRGDSATEGRNQDGVATDGSVTSPNQVQRISESQLVGLPLNGRSYNQLATLQAGVSDPSAASSSRGTSGGGLTVSGGRATSNTFLEDGINIMDARNRSPRSAAGVQLGSDSVLQVQVFSTSYSAQYGRDSGGVLNSITRSGTPEFHGTLFEFFRNSKLDARNFFDPTNAPPFKRNQFGFTVTGPIRKDRTYFMGAFEAMVDRLSETDISLFPDMDARSGVITDRAGNEIRTVSVSERVKPYLRLYPVPNLERRGEGIAEHSASVFQPTNEMFWVIRVDQQISQRDAAFVRYSIDDATNEANDGVFLFRNLANSRAQHLTLAHSHFIGLTGVNALRFGYTRPVSHTTPLAPADIPRELYFIPDSPILGQLEVPGLTTFGQLAGPSGDVVNTFQLGDDILLRRGAHELKFGFEVHRYRWDVFSNTNRGGVWSFNSLDSFLKAGPGGTNLTAVLPGSDNTQANRQTLIGFYVQDSYNLSRNIHLDLGLRHEFTTTIHERTGKAVFLPDPIHDSQVQTGRFLDHNPSLHKWAPRLGLRWAPGGSRSTALSAGFGIYYDQLLQYAISTRKASVPFYKKVIRTNFDSTTTFPDAVAAAVGVPFQAQVIDYYGMTIPMVLRYDFGVEQQLSSGFRLQLSYVGARGNHLFRSYEANLYPVAQIQPDGSVFLPPFSGDQVNAINPAFTGGLTILASDAQSFYNSARIAVSKSAGQRFSIQGSYTFSKSVDDDSSGTSDNGLQYPLIRTSERGLSDFDIRHRFVLNYFLSLPFGSGQRLLGSGIAAQLLSGWRLGGILSFRTGTPFNPQANVRTENYLFSANRPNLMVGQKINRTEGVSAGCADATGRVVVRAGESLGTPQRYFDPCAFAVPLPGTIGNVGRNTITAPSQTASDISLQRDFTLGGEKRLQFRAEMFNLLNHSNFSAPAGGGLTVFSGVFPGRATSSAGRISKTSTTSRQLQFALRLSF